MTPIPPDVTARELRDAQALLREAGWRVAQVRFTGPPGAIAGEGEPRVLRQRVTAEGEVQLVVAHPRHVRAPRQRRVRD